MFLLIFYISKKNAADLAGGEQKEVEYNDPRDFRRVAISLQENICILFPAVGERASLFYSVTNIEADG